MNARTLAGLLRDRALHRGDEPALRCRDGEAWRERSWSSYWVGAQQAAAGLWARGVRPGDRVLMLVTDVEPAILTLFGAWCIGAVPVQIGLPYRLTDLAGFISQLRDTATRLDASALVVSTALAPFADASTELPVHLAEEILAGGSTTSLPDPEAAAGTTALIQLTSGSTGRPRGVILTHDRLMHHLAAMSAALPSHADSVAVSWLPLHHDMGLIGGLLFPFYNGFVAHMLSPAQFRARPLLWLEVMSEVHATICAAPPSAYSMLLRVAERAASAGLDLSRWECAMIGAEPIPAALLRRFADAYAPTGFRPQAFFPVYGLAEATVAVSFPRLLAPTRTERIDRDSLARGEALESNDDAAIELVCVGRPIPGTEVRVVDPNGDVLPDRRIGELEVRAPSLSIGYHDDPVATAAAFHEGWLRTGDLGYQVDGALFITGRSKELIIRGGQNLIPTVIEELAAEVEGTRPGGVAAVGVHAPELETEVVHLVVETREPEAEWPALKQRLDAALRTRGVVVDRIHLVEPGALPRTTSGKLRRRALADSLANP